MVRLVISCLWVCIVTLGSTYATIALKMRHAEAATQADTEKVSYDKTRPINVPMIANGSVQGYVVAQFSYLAETEDATTSKLPIEAFILDEAFKTIYSDDKLDFQHLEKYDIAGLTKDLVAKVNTRMNKHLLKDVLVEEFNYITKEEISR